MYVDGHDFTCKSRAHHSLHRVMYEWGLGRKAHADR